MRIDQTVLDTLCCPIGRGALTRTAGPDVDRLNEAVAQGRGRYAGGQTVTEALAGGLVTTGGGSFYRIQEGVPGDAWEASAPTPEGGSSSFRARVRSTIEPKRGEPVR